MHMVYPRQGEPLHLCYYLTFLFFTNSQIKHCKSPCNVGFDQTSVMNVCACACVSARVCVCQHKGQNNKTHYFIFPIINYAQYG